ncbi:MAG: DNA repair protein RadA, partial [Gammaproteobacteria bacterium]
MAKKRPVFVCSECGASAPRWQGQCQECGEWNTMQEMAGSVPSPARAGGYAGEAPRTLGSIDGELESRTSIGIGELDRVLGGGLVPGSVILLGGDP